MIANQLARLPGLMASYGSWTDERWWNNAGVTTNTGISVSAETALKVGAYYACLKVIGETVLSAPCPIYRKLPNGDRELATEHPVWPILHGDDPNDIQTSGEWLETHTVITAHRGTSYSLVEPGNRGPITHMEYQAYEDVNLTRLPSGVLVYKIRNPLTGASDDYNADEVFRFPGLSINGITGLSVLDHARESLGISLALQNHAGSTFRQGLRTSGVLEYPNTFKDQAAADRLRAQWNEVYAGSANAGKTIILENGMTYKQMDLTNEDIQMLGSEQFQVTDIARWFRMPLVMIGEQAGVSNFGTGVEQYMIGFVWGTMLPWFIRLEKRINKQLIEPLNSKPGEYYAEFNIEGLLRGDVKSRFEAYQIAVGGNGPWMNRQEVRRRENLNKGPAELEEFLQPMNMNTAGQPPTPRGTVGRPAALLTDPDAIKADPRYRGYAAAVARQLVVKETKRIAAEAKRHADDGEGFAAAITTFYGEMAGDLAERAYLPAGMAQRYADGARERALLGVKDAESWQDGKVDELLGLMLSAEVAA